MRQTSPDLPQRQGGSDRQRHVKRAFRNFWPKCLTDRDHVVLAFKVHMQSSIGDEVSNLSDPSHTIDFQNSTVTPIRLNQSIGGQFHTALAFNRALGKEDNV